MPPNDISSSYSYLTCLISFIRLDGSSVCIQYAPSIMDVLKITPPFYYSYQCGSTLLTSYLPVYMYSISLHTISTVAFFVFIISTNTTTTRYSRWLLKLFPGICWPSHWSDVDDRILDLDNPIRLINPYRIISSVVHHTVLLLSFGLCSPVLCFYISLSICLRLCYWLILIGRFVSFRTDALEASAAGSLPLLIDFLTSSLPFCFKQIAELAKTNSCVC